MADAFADIALNAAFNICTEANLLLSDSLFNDFVKPGKCTAAYKQNVCRVNLIKLLMRMLSSALRRNRRNRSLQNFQKRLLNALSAYVARY